MPSPFPGMDPYLEGPLWPDVHHELASTIRRQLTPRLGPDYVARISTLVVPVLPAVSIRLVTVEIRSTPTGRLITAIEIVSPVNKRGEGLQKYRRKRERLRSARVHLLETDLLRRGERVVPGRQVPRSDYLVSLTRAGADVSELWPIGLRDPLPTVPVPLRPEDEDIPLSLAAALREVYEAAAYNKSIDYSQPPPPPELSPEDSEWARQVASR